MGMTKKVTIIGLSSVVLVAVVVAVVVTVKQSQPGEATSSSGVTTSNKQAKAICQPVDYKEACEESLANTNSTDPKELIKVGFGVAMKDLSDAINNSETLQKVAKDPRTSQAYSVCQDVLKTAVDDLQRSFDKVGTFDVTKIDDYVDDLKTWLSGVITYQDTCVDAFENTTGDAAEKMKKLLETSSQLSSNALAMVTELTKMLSSLQIPGVNRKLLSTEDPDYIPGWMNSHQRKLLRATPRPNVVVALDGSGQFKSINEAIKTVPLKNTVPFVILIKAGVYREYVEVPRKVNNVVFIGEGATKTKIVGNKNFIDGINTYRTATVVINGDGFVAKDIGFENSAGAAKHQAVALRVSADRAIFFRCQMDGYQDTLYTHTYRQFYRDCTISGTIDFIFGDAAAVFQNCKMIVRKPLENQACMVTAQGRKDHRGTGGLVLQNCYITAEPAFKVTVPAIKSYLGRPWKEFSRTIIMQSFIDSNIAPEGWAPWMGTFGLDTSYYAEYQNRGPGSNTATRVTWKGIKRISPQEALSFTAGTFIQGDTWVRASGVPYDTGMMRV